VDVDAVDDRVVAVGGGVLVVVVRALDGVGIAPVVVAVVDVGRGTTVRGGTDPGRTKMYSTSVTAKIALSASVERRM